MNADEKRKVFEELLEEYQNYIESEFSYDDGEREAERKAWLNKYDGIKEPLIKDEKIRKAVQVWAEANSQRTSVVYQQLDETNSCISFIDFGGLVIEFNKPIDGLTSGKTYKFAELCGEEEE